MCLDDGEEQEQETILNSNLKDDPLLADSAESNPNLARVQRGALYLSPLPPLPKRVNHVWLGRALPNRDNVKVSNSIFEGI